MSAMRMNLVVIGVVLALSGTFALALMLPGTKKMSAKQAEVSDALKEVQNKQAELGNVSELYASIQAMDQQTKDYREKLPEDKAFGEFLRAVSANLKKEGIEDFVVQPHEPMSIDDTRLSPSYLSAKGTIVLPVSLQFETDLGKLFGFLSQMDKLTRLSTVENMTLLNNENKPGHVAVEMMVHTYQHP